MLIYIKNYVCYTVDYLVINPAKTIFNWVLDYTINRIAAWWEHVQLPLFPIVQNIINEKPTIKSVVELTTMMQGTNTLLRSIIELMNAENVRQSDLMVQLLKNNNAHLSNTISDLISSLNNKEFIDEIFTTFLNHHLPGVCELHEIHVSRLLSELGDFRYLETLALLTKEISATNNVALNCLGLINPSKSVMEYSLGAHNEFLALNGQLPQQREYEFALDHNQPKDFHYAQSNYMDYYVDVDYEKYQKRQN